MEPVVVRCQGVKCCCTRQCLNLAFQHEGLLQLRGVVLFAGARTLVQAQAAGLQAIMQACGGHTDLAKFW